MIFFIFHYTLKIKKDELYIQDNDYGLEKETHVTLVACLDNDVKYEELKPYLSNLSDYKVILTDISVFECDDYDVLKCSAQSYENCFKKAHGFSRGMN